MYDMLRNKDGKFEVMHLLSFHENLSYLLYNCTLTKQEYYNTDMKSPDGYNVFTFAQTMRAPVQWETLE